MEFWAKTFTFQYGRLKTGRGGCTAVLDPEFTFQYGRLKTHLLFVGDEVRQQFTFQYGRLKTNAVRRIIEPHIDIYIPIWTIKDVSVLPSCSSTPAFTFQYGRLKTSI